MRKNFYSLITILLLLMSSIENTAQTGNPLLDAWNTPYETPPFDKIKNEHFLPAFQEAIKISKAEIDAIVSNPEEADFENTMAALDRAGEKLSRVSMVFFNLEGSETNPELQKTAREVMPLLTDYSNDISLNEELFKRVKHVYDNRNSLNLNDEQKRLSEESYIGFIRQGAGLSSEDKEKFRDISKELSMLTLTFGQNVLAETNNYKMHITDKNDLSGLPEGVIESAAGDAKARGLDGWVFTLQQPSYVAFLKYADNRKLREELFRAYNSKGNNDNEYDNKENIRKITSLRLEMSKLLGSPTFADYGLKYQMAENPDRVNKLLNELLEAAKPVAMNDIAEVRKFAESTGADFEIQPWDFSYYSEKLKAQKYSVDDELTRPYFPLDKVIDGVFELANRLYGLNFTEQKDIPVFNPEVKTYKVTDDKGKFMSILYLDFFPREGKRGGAWMSGYRSQFKVGDEDNRPFVSLTCNFTRPTETKPALLTFNEAVTFLHEFGHGLHGMLSDVTYEGLSGTGVARDFVELPSQIMENWAVRKEFLDIFAAHYQTGEKIPAELIQKIIDSRNFNEGYACMRQLSFGVMDMAYHSIDEPITGDVVEFEKNAIEPTLVLPDVPGISTATAFNHIFSGGYAAGYYSYKWAEVLDADAFSLFEKNGIFDKKTADSFRDNILSKGNTEKPMTLYVRFRGQEPSIDALLRRSGFIK